MPVTPPFWTISATGPRPDFLASVPPQDFATASARTRPYTSGPAIEIAGPRGLRFGADLLYRRLGFTETRMSRGVTSSRESILIDQKVTANRWDAAFTVRRAFGKPFVSGGLAYNRISGAHFDMLFGSRTDFVLPPSMRLTRYTGEFEPTRRQSFGVVFGAGLELRRGRFKIAPEGRLWSWFSRNFDDVTARSKAQQVDFLLGLLL